MARTIQIVRGQTSVTLEITDKMEQEHLVLAEGEVYADVPDGDYVPKIPNAPGKVQDLTDEEWAAVMRSK